jgi:hypothetical protein
VDKIIDKIKNTPDWKSRDGYDVSDKVETSHFLTPNGELIGNYNHNTMVTDLSPMIDGFELTGKTGGGTIEEKDGTWTKLPYKPHATWNDITNFLAHTGFVRATNEGIGERGFGHSVNLTVNGILTNSQIRAIQRMEQTSSAGTTLVFDIMGDETQSGHGTFRDFMKAYRKNYGTEAFQEQDHPRDEDGKFTDKSSIRTNFDQMFKDDTKEDFKIQEDHIEKVKEWYKEAIEQKVKWQNGAEYTIGKGKNKRKITEEDFDRIIEDKKQRIKNEEDELVEMHSMLDSYDDRPVIKITDSPNTQSVGIKGFKNGVGKFKGLSRGVHTGKDMIIGGIFEDDIGGTYIDSSLNKNTSELAFKNLEYVKEAWNLLPDEDRNLIHFLKFRFSNSDKKNLGSFNAGFKQGNPAKWYMLNTIEVMLSNTVKSGTGAINTLMHEIGHVKWDQIQQLSPEKTKRFTQRMREIGNITPYQKTYENAVKTQESKNEEKRNSKAYKEGTDEYRKNMDKNMAEELENQYIIYGNEAHSEFYASLHAPTLNYGHRISQDNMEKVAEAYKELHGIVD